MQIDGQRHCGQVRYEAEIDPERVSICHCTDCQRLTGSPFRVTVLASRKSIHLTGIPPKVYVKTGDSSRKRMQYFCSECGSPMFTGGEGADAEEWGIRWGGHTTAARTCAETADLAPLRRALARRSRDLAPHGDRIGAAVTRCHPGAPPRPGDGIPDPSPQAGASSPRSIPNGSGWSSAYGRPPKVYTTHFSER